MKTILLRDECEYFSVRELLLLSNEDFLIYNDIRRIETVDLMIWIRDETKKSCAGWAKKNIVIETGGSKSEIRSSPNIAVVRLLLKERVFSEANSGVTYRFGVGYADLRIFISSLFSIEMGKNYYFCSGTISSKSEMEKYFCNDLTVKSSLVFERDIRETIIMKDENPIFGVRKKILILIPTYNRFQKTKNSLLSILNSFRKTEHFFKILVGDNATKEEGMKEWLVDFGKNDEVEVTFNEKNLGKARMVNKLFKENQGSYDYLFSIDSDMVALNEKSFLGMIGIMEGCFNVGLVSSNQLGECHHWFGKTVFKKKEIGFNIGESKNGIGVSGGCVAMRIDDWKKIDGYRENYDLYTGDDAILMEKVEKKLGKRVLIGVDFPLYHPHPTEDEKGYKDWKMKRFNKDGLRFREEGHKGEMEGGYWD
jgi:hypothetical protein